MRPALLLVALLVAAPAAYAWWSGRKIRRSLDDPALAELLQARQRRLAQVTLVAVIATAFTGVPMVVAVLTLLGLLVAQYPIRRAVFGDEWSLAQYVAYCTASFVAGAGLWLFALLVPSMIAPLVRQWMPMPSRAAFVLALGLGALCGVVVLVWHRWFTRIWLSLHRASPLGGDARHAALLPRLNAVLDRAADRLRRRPSIHRYGAMGGRVANAVALCSLYEPAVAMSDTLLATLDADETTTIFAHEIAHHEHYDAHRLRTRLWLLVVVALIVAVLPALQLATGPSYAVLTNVAFTLAMVTLLVRGQAGRQSQETASDLRALELTNDPDALIRALTKIHVLARMPRRWAQEFERAATHPSLARRIQAIRARATLESAKLSTPTVIAAATAGAYVALDDARAYWFDGVPAETPPDLSSLREHAASYRAMTYAELSELRLVAGQGQRALRATDLAGRSWSVDVRETDVATIQTALDAVDSRLGTSRVEPVARSERVARVLAATLLLAALLGGGTSAVAIPALASLAAPTTASLAAMGAMGAASVLLLSTEGALGMPHDATAVLLVVALGLWAGWIAWNWYRARHEPTAAGARIGTRIMFALLGLTALTTLLFESATLTSLPDLASDEMALSLAITLFGLGAALLTLRARTLRVAGAGTAMLGVVAMGAVTLGERLWPSTSEIGWSSGTLSLVATLPLAHDVSTVTLSPAGTRYLTRRGFGDDDEESFATELSTGDVATGAAPYTVTALDAALPNETEMLVLAMAARDSVELLLERVHADSAQRVVWRQPLGKLAAPTLRLLDGNTRWQVSGLRVDSGSVVMLVTLDGALDGDSVRRSEVRSDTLRGQPVFSYRDGSRLLVGVARNPFAPAPSPSALWTALTMLRGVNVTWRVWRHDREGSHLLASLHGYVRCWPGAEEDVAICVDQGRRGVHVLSIARTGSIVDLGTLSRRFDRATGSPQGQIVASSFRDRSLAVVDVARRRGLRLVLPEGSTGYTRDATATSNVLAVVLTGEGGSRLMVYRLGPLIETASNPERNATRSRR